MLRLVTRRLLLSVLTLFIVSLVVFAGVELLPGDLATAFLGREATPTRVASLRAELGLDRPATERYLNWLGNVVQGDLGMSLAKKKPIGELIGLRMRNTLLLGLTAGLIGLPLALVLGIIAGLTRDRRPDLWISTISLIFMTLPQFVTATFLILLFAITWPIFPAVTTVPPDSPIKELLPNIVLPVAALVFVMVAHNLRMVRTGPDERDRRHDQRLCSNGDLERCPAGQSGAAPCLAQCPSTNHQSCSPVHRLARQRRGHHRAGL
jgi:peptide/nickel transport system permease protein